MLITALWILLAALFVLLVLHLVQRYVLPAFSADPKSQKIIMAIVAVIAIIALLAVVWPHFGALGHP